MSIVDVKRTFFFLISILKDFFFFFYFTSKENRQPSLVCLVKSQVSETQKNHSENKRLVGRGVGDWVDIVLLKLMKIKINGKSSEE